MWDLLNSTYLSLATESMGVDELNIYQLLPPAPEGPGYHVSMIYNMNMIKL